MQLCIPGTKDVDLQDRLSGRNTYNGDCVSGTYYP